MSPILHTYVLADGALHPEIIAPLLEAAGISHQSVYATLQEDNLGNARLFLAQVPDPQAAWVIQLETLDAQEPCLSFIKSYLPLADLAKHLRQFLIADQGEGQTLFLRYFDPRLLRPVLDTWDPNALKQLLLPIAVWVYRGSHKEWQTLNGYGEAHAPRHYDPIRLTETQLDALRAITKPYVELWALTERGLIDSELPYAERYADYQQRIGRAKAQGLTGSRDIDAFVIDSYRREINTK